MPTAANAEAATLCALIAASARGDGERASTPRPTDVMDARCWGKNRFSGTRRGRRVGTLWGET